MTALLRALAALAILLGGGALVLTSSADQRAPLPTTVAGARRALIRSPLDDRALESLVRADDAAGRWREEKRLIPLASPRNLPLRFMALSSNAANGDLDAAIRDADILLRQRAYNDPIITFLRTATAYPEGRTAIAARLAQRPGWREDFLIRQRDLAPTGHADAVALLTVMNDAAPPTADEREALANVLVAAGDVDAAFTLRAAFTPPGTDLLVDGGLSRRSPSPSGLFGWSFGVPPTREDRPGLPLDGAGGGIVVRQIVFADPGRHLLRWRIEHRPDAPPPPSSWSVRCLSPASTPILGPITSENNATITDFRQQIDIAQGCPMQVLALSIDPVTSMILGSRLRSVSLSR